MAAIGGKAAPPPPTGCNDELEALLAKCNISEQLRALLIDKDFLEPIDIALIGVNETEATQAVEAVLPGDQSVPWDLTAKKNFKKLYIFCKSASHVANPGAASAPVPSRVADDEEGLPEGVPEAIEAAWAKKHNFHLSGARLLIGGDYNRVYNCVMKKKPMELPKMNPEKYRLANEGITGESKGLFLGEDGTVSASSKCQSQACPKNQ